MIHVRRAGEQASPVFEVVVREGKGETRHHVTMSREMSERLTAGKHTPERHVEAAFRFLLDREPKESILRTALLAKPVNGINAPQRPDCVADDAVSCELVSAPNQGK
jgi:hypothetical protein